MQYILKSKAKIAIIMVQDIIGLDDSARINYPRNRYRAKLVMEVERF